MRPSRSQASTRAADDLDNCPLDANPGQEDTDGDSIGDACDVDCNGADPPVITLLMRDETSASGTVDDCAGIDALGLGPLSENVTLEILAGMPGDTQWSWQVQSIVALDPGFAELVATDGLQVLGTLEIELTDPRPIEIPTLGGVGLSMLIALLGLAGGGRLRRWD